MEVTDNDKYDRFLEHFVYPGSCRFIYFILFYLIGIGEKEKTPGADSRNNTETSEVVLRRTQSFEADEK